MRCTSPRTVGFLADGKTLCWSKKKYCKDYATFQLPCGKCLECRLDYARQWAVRCVHEAYMHEDNCFVTLTYSDEKLESPKLIYKHFQNFLKRLRRAYPYKKIGVFVTGEYGDKRKRPHFHACVFNWRPNDARYKYTSDRGDVVYESDHLTKLWGYGIAEFGEVTFESAGYCARYAAKKLIHGKDQDHDFQPISKKSSKHAIGKKWIEKYWPDVFNYGHIILHDGTKCSIPRYYEKWLKQHKPIEWEKYATTTKSIRSVQADIRSSQEKAAYAAAVEKRRASGSLSSPPTKLDHRRKITNQRFNQLQKNLKL